MRNYFYFLTNNLKKRFCSRKRKEMRDTIFDCSFDSLRLISTKKSSWRLFNRMISMSSSIYSASFFSPFLSIEKHRLNILLHPLIELMNKLFKQHQSEEKKEIFIRRRKQENVETNLLWCQNFCYNMLGRNQLSMATWFTKIIIKTLTAFLTNSDDGWSITNHHKSLQHVLMEE